MSKLVRTRNLEAIYIVKTVALALFLKTERLYSDSGNIHVWEFCIEGPHIFSS
jgi:hypothetical protein